jgi:hypothetical protein
MGEWVAINIRLLLPCLVGDPQDECRYRDYSAVNGQDIATVVAERIMFSVRDISTEHFKVRACEWAGEASAPRVLDGEVTHGGLPRPPLV